MPENADTLCGGIGSEQIDPTGRLDIAASRVIERLMPRLADRFNIPELQVLYTGFRPQLELLLSGLLGPRPEPNGVTRRRPPVSNRKRKSKPKRRLYASGR